MRFIIYVFVFFALVDDHKALLHKVDHHPVSLSRYIHGTNMTHLSRAYDHLKIYYTGANTP